MAVVSCQSSVVSLARPPHAIVVEMLLVAWLVLAMAQTIPGTAMPVGTRPLIGTYWKATEIAGKAAPTQDAKREAHLVFEAGARFSGSDGCNGISGTYELKDDNVRFSAGISTQKACIDIGTFDAAFRGALKGATHLTITADRLELFDAAAKRLAIFTGRAQSVRN